MYHSILTLRSVGASQREIARALRISKTTVNKYLSKPEAAGEIDSCQRGAQGTRKEIYIDELATLKQHRFLNRHDFESNHEPEQARKTAATQLPAKGLDFMLAWSSAL